MTFAAAEWLYLFPLLLLVSWVYFRPLIFKPLRMSILLLLFIALSQPSLTVEQKGIDLWVLLDRSDSVKDKLQVRLKEWQEVLEKSRGKYDRIFYVDYAGTALKVLPDAEVPSFDSKSSNLADALRYTAGLTKDNRASRVLVLTDGYSTDSFNGLAERLERQKLEMDYRLIDLNKETDFKVERLTLPHRVQLGESFMIEAEVSGEIDGLVDCEISRDLKSVYKGKVKVENGRGTIRLYDRLANSGNHQYELRIDHKQDSLSGNNTCQNWLRVQGGRKVLLLSSYQNDPLQAVLRKQGFDCQLINKFDLLRADQLTTAKLVILNNVPAWKLPQSFFKQLKFYVEEQGGGLVMAGGKFSFGAGAYSKSTVEELMPVSMELKVEHRKLMAAISIVMDRSGSMGVGVKGGKTKMDLANDGASRTVELLGSQDQISVSAVDSTWHSFVRLQTIGNNQKAIIKKIRSVKSMGGGIYVYEGLSKAWDELQNSVAQKHIILFSDAADSEQPGAYIRLLEEIRDALKK